MTKFKGKYRVESARLPGWDYAAPGHYFVTICTRDRVCHFGRVAGGAMHLSPIGKIVAEEWTRTEQLRPYVEIDEWVVMPNHIHGIIVIHERDAIAVVETTRRVVSTPATPLTAAANTQRRVVSTETTTADTTTDRPDAPTGLRDRPGAMRQSPPRLHPNSLGAIIGQFKSVCTKRIRAAGFDDFGWQPRFHDHIIRDEKSLERIRQYIRDNAANWEQNTYHPAQAPAGVREVDVSGLEIRET